MFAFSSYTYVFHWPHTIIYIVRTPFILPVHGSALNVRGATLHKPAQTASVFVAFRRLVSSAIH